MSTNKRFSKVIYSSRGRGDKLSLRAMWFDLLASRELAWRLLVRDISARYRQSLLGVFWAFVPAIVTAIGFTLARNTGVINIGDTDIPYPAYVMFSMTLWQTFTEALNGPSQAISASSQMLAKINFPREALILTKLGEIFFNFGIKLLLLIGMFIWFKVQVNWAIVLAPVALIHLIFLGTFLGLLIAIVNSLYRDFSNLLSLMTSFWLFLTPVVYPVPKDGLFGMVVKLNPVTPLLVTTRELATTGIVSEPTMFWVVSAIALVGLILAWMLYRLAMPILIERMSS
jgi:lipopolysaccharide transport system permease protein